MKSVVLTWTEISPLCNYFPFQNHVLSRAETTGSALVGVYTPPAGTQFACIPRQGKNCSVCDCSCKALCHDRRMIHSSQMKNRYASVSLTGSVLGINGPRLKSKCTGFPTVPTRQLTSVFWRGRIFHPSTTERVVLVCDNEVTLRRVQEEILRSSYAKHRMELFLGQERPTVGCTRQAMNSMNKLKLVCLTILAVKKQ